MQGERGLQGLQGAGIAKIEYVESDNGDYIVVTLTDSTYKTVYLPAQHEHTYDYDGEYVIVEATTQHAGLSYNVCLDEDCNHVEYYVIPKLIPYLTYNDVQFDNDSGALMVAVDPSDEVNLSDAKSAIILGLGVNYYADLQIFRGTNLILTPQDGSFPLGFNGLVQLYDEDGNTIANIRLSYDFSEADLSVGTHTVQADYWGVEYDFRGDPETQYSISFTDTMGLVDIDSEFYSADDTITFTTDENGVFTLFFALDTDDMQATGSFEITIEPVE